MSSPAVSVTVPLLTVSRVGAWLTLVISVPLVSTYLPSPLIELSLVTRTPMVRSVGLLASSAVMAVGRSSVVAENDIDSPAVRKLTLFTPADPSPVLETL